MLSYFLFYTAHFTATLNFQIFSSESIMCYKQVLMGYSIVVYTVLITYQRSMTSARKMETFDFEAWSSKILDINSVNFNDENKNEHSELLNTNYGIQLFTYATDCNQKGSRWDYLTSSAKPIKKLNTTNGFVTFTIPKKGTRYASKFGSGFRAKHCLKFGLDIAHEFSGNLTNGLIEGKTMVKFKDGTKLEGFSKQSFLYPMFRYFKDEDNKFLNLTAYFQNGKYVVTR